jgi:PAS domain S-box-containing protein
MHSPALTLKTAEDPLPNIRIPLFSTSKKEYQTMGNVLEITTADQLDASGPDNYQDIYRTLFEKSGMCMASLDPAFRVLEANTDFFHRFGRSPDHVRGRPFSEFLHPSIQEKLDRQFARLSEGRHTRFSDHVVATGPDGAMVTGELTAVAVPGETGSVGMIMVMIAPPRAQPSIQLVSAKKLLTAIDAKVLEGVAAGISTIQLAALLFLSRGGVEYHVATLMRKFKVANRPALVSKCYSTGVFVLGSWPPRVLPEYTK